MEFQTGAVLVYTPERGINLNSLKGDVKFLKNRYSLDSKGKSEGRLVIRSGVSPILWVFRLNLFSHRNEAASSVYTTDFLTNMLKEEGGDLFDARSASLGHTLQGGIPSPLDRARAVRLSLKCIVFLEMHHNLLAVKPPTQRHATDDSAAVITIQGSSVKWVPVQEMVPHADMKNRRGKTAWWGKMSDLVESLVGRHQLVGL